MAVMSAERSSSAVRNLRSIFENKETEVNSTQEIRRRSESTEPGKEGKRPLSKVRSSFVAVDTGRVMEEPTKTDTIVEQEGDEVQVAPSRTSASLRRPSFSANSHDSEELGLKKVITNESERRGRDESVQEAIPESAIESTPGTPLAQPAGDLRSSLFTKSDVAKASKLSETTTPSPKPEPPANPDKPVTGAEEGAGNLRPADLTSKAEVSDKAETINNALPNRSKPAPAPEDVKSAVPEAPKAEPQATPKVKAVPAKQISSSKPLSSKDVQSSESISAPTSVANGIKDASPVSASKPASKTLDRKVSRSSLTAAAAAAAPKASSTARSEHTDLSAKPKPRETTKPLEISAHLLAPTAASRARHEADNTAASTTTKDASKSVRASIGPSTSRPTPRTSLARQSRPGSRASQSAAVRKPPVPAPDGSFLERMTRPTAASQNRAQEKFEARVPPKKTQPAVSRKPAAIRPKKESTTSSAPAQTGDQKAQSTQTQPVDQVASTTSTGAS